MTLKDAPTPSRSQLTPPLDDNPAYTWRNQPKRRKGLIVTDLDGTFLDRNTYSPAASLATLRRALKEDQIVVFCSSKTPFEQKHLQESLGIQIPFISENGSAIHFPRKDFPEFEGKFPQEEEWLVLRLGMSFPEIQAVLEEYEKAQTIDLGRMARIPVSKLAEITGLSEPAALRARSRLFSETLTAPLTEETKKHLKTYLRDKGLKFECGGRYHTVTAVNTDKGKAFTRLKALIQTVRGDLLTLGLGDSENDLSLLETVHFPVLVAKPDGSHEPVELDLIHRNGKPGPHGWAATVEEWLKMMSN